MKIKRYWPTELLCWILFIGAFVLWSWLGAAYCFVVIVAASLGTCMNLKKSDLLG